MGGRWARWAVARRLTLILRGMRLEQPGTDLVGAECSYRSHFDRENQACVSEKKTKGGAVVKSKTYLGGAEGGKQRFQVNVDVCPANLLLANQKHFENQFFALGPSYNYYYTFKYSIQLNK